MHAGEPAGVTLPLQRVFPAVGRSSRVRRRSPLTSRAIAFPLPRQRPLTGSFPYRPHAPVPRTRHRRNWKPFPGQSTRRRLRSCARPSVVTGFLLSGNPGGCLAAPRSLPAASRLRLRRSSVEGLPRATARRICTTPARMVGVGSLRSYLWGGRGATAGRRQ